MWKTFSSGADWLTATAEKGDSTLNALDDLGTELLLTSMEQGHEVKTDSLRDYRGKRSNHIYVGWRKTGMILQVSGGAAHDAALMLRERIPDVKLSRFDLEVSCQAPEGSCDLVRELNRKMDKRDYRTKKNRQLVAGLQLHPRRGNTFYIGSRSSVRYRRVYNKSFEQRGKIAPRVWRAELETHDDVAMSAFREFVRADCTNTMARNIVVTDFEACGVDMSWVGPATLHRIPTTYEPTDDERRFAWLSNYVSKTVRMLEDRYGGEAVAKALGLRWRPPQD